MCTNGIKMLSHKCDPSGNEDIYVCAYNIGTHRFYNWCVQSVIVLMFFFVLP